MPASSESNHVAGHPLLTGGHLTGLAHRGFAHPAFWPLDLTYVRSADELKDMLTVAFRGYVQHLESVLRRQKMWAFLMEDFLQDPKEADNLRFVKSRITSDEHWVRYSSATGDVDHMLPTAAPLFAYADKTRVMDQVTKGGLHTSYGTTIPPYDTTISLKVMRRVFSNIEPSIPGNCEIARAAVPMDHFIAFLPSTGFSPKARLAFDGFDVAFEGDFEHYTQAPPQLEPGQYLTYDIVAFGPTFIPEGVPSTEVTHNKTGEGRVPVQVNCVSTGQSD